jgi:hypothetical protein
MPCNLAQGPRVPLYDFEGVYKTRDAHCDSVPASVHTCGSGGSRGCHASNLEQRAEVKAPAIGVKVYADKGSISNGTCATCTACVKIDYVALLSLTFCTPSMPREELQGHSQLGNPVTHDSCC